jgi:hypothetical protein
MGDQKIAMKIEEMATMRKQFAAVPETYINQYGLI